ncbi:MAG: hypothetical protein AAF409_10115 [Pseudomonadota bacterium]
MSDTDSFIQEVTEEVRKDRMYSLWKKWGPVVIGAIVVIVGGAAYWSWQESQVRAAAEARGGTFIAADPGDVSQMTALPERIDGPASLIARLTAAAALVADGQAAEARAAYQSIAAEPGTPPEYADLAVLQAARLAEGDAGAARQSLAPLIEPGRPYRVLALELRAALAMEAGDTAAAHQDLRTIVADPAASASARQRAQIYLQVTGGAPAEADG